MPGTGNQSWASVKTPRYAQLTFGFLDGDLWVHVESLSGSICASIDPPTVIRQRSLPAHSAGRKPSIWFYSRGCWGICRTMLFAVPPPPMGAFPVGREACSRDVHRLVGGNRADTRAHGRSRARWKSLRRRSSKDTSGWQSPTGLPWVSRWSSCSGPADCANLEELDVVPEHGRRGIGFRLLVRRNIGMGHGRRSSMGDKLFQAFSRRAVERSVLPTSWVSCGQTGRRFSPTRRARGCRAGHAACEPTCACLWSTETSGRRVG